MKENIKSIDKFEKEKRQEPVPQDEDYVNYDYSALKADYEAEVAKEKVAKDTLKYKDVKEEETVKDAIKTALIFSAAKNCTEEEMKGIGQLNNSRIYLKTENLHFYRYKRC